MNTSAPITFVLNAHTAAKRYAAAMVVMKRLTCSPMCLLAIVVNSHTVRAVMAVKRISKENGFHTMLATRQTTKRMPVMVRSIRFFTVP